MYTVKLVEIFLCNGKKCTRVSVLYHGDNKQLASIEEYKNTLSFHSVKRESVGDNVVISIVDKQF